MTLSPIDVREDAYTQFIESKIATAADAGLPNWAGTSINDNLKPFQVSIVREAIKKGRFAVFADCGMGKTLMQLAWADVIARETNGRVVIVAPLSIIDQTISEAIKFGISAIPTTDLSDKSARIHIVNYERVDHVDESMYSGVVIDESSILKNETGAVKKALIAKFAATPYRLACTATPAPNDYAEMGNHSEFLGIMPCNIMLAKFFDNDLSQNNVWHLKTWAKSDFWAWVRSWAVAIKKPSDLGFSDEGYDLPRLNVTVHDIPCAGAKVGMFEDVQESSVSATEYHAAVRATFDTRLAKAKAILDTDGDGQWIIWVHHNEESKAVCAAIQGAVEVTGSDPQDVKSSKFNRFKSGEIRILVTKREIASFGLNFQNCHNQLFMAVDFRFESFYQAIRRSYRFGQSREVNCHIICPAVMANAKAAISRKMDQFVQMQSEMCAVISQSSTFRMTNNAEIKRFDGNKFTIFNADCVEAMRRMDSNSVDFSVFSPPFADLYTYSEDYRDMGNCESNERFLEHYKFMARELLRILRPGRLVAVHVRNLNVSKSKKGHIGLYDLRGDLIRAMEECGFVFHTEVTIWTNPVVEMQRTKHIGLLYKAGKKDWTNARMGRPDNIIVFRKWEGIEDSGLHVKVGQDSDEFTCDMWQQWASPVWFDINMERVLNTVNAKATDREKHICPLQLDVIHRCVRLWTNKGDTVFSPFAGIGSEGYESILCGRKFIGVELKESYFNEAIKNLRNAEEKSGQLTMF